MSPAATPLKMNSTAHYNTHFIHAEQGYHECHAKKLEGQSLTPRKGVSVLQTSYGALRMLLRLVLLLL